MNNRLEIATKALFAFAISRDEKEEQMTLDECRQAAAAILVMTDRVMSSSVNLNRAIIDAGYEPSEYMEQFLNVFKELQNQEEENLRFFVSDMAQAWAKGHEEGFWEARMTDKTAPAVIPSEVGAKLTYTEADVKQAEKEGYVSGWGNGVLSLNLHASTENPSLLLGYDHAVENNPYKKGLSQ